MISHNAPQSVISAFNPIVTLKSKVRETVNKDFILPIVKAFFGDAFDNYEELHPDKLKTEIEFNTEVIDVSFIKSYIYKEIVSEISKPNKKVEFKPKYVITFDYDLTNWQEKNHYPCEPTKSIRYGVMQLGNAPILYYIYVDLQDLIKFIKKHIPIEKTIENEMVFEDKIKNINFELSKNQRLIDEKIEDVDTVNELNRQRENLLQSREQRLQGKSGQLRVNLRWFTEDDLDLHIVTPNDDEIFYGNKEEKNGKGKLDIDSNAGQPFSSTPAENVYWEELPLGKYKIIVDFFNSRQTTKVIFELKISPENSDLDGWEIKSFVESQGQNKRREIVTFEYEKNEESEKNKVTYTNLLM